MVKIIKLRDPIREFTVAHACSGGLFEGGFLEGGGQFENLRYKVSSVEWKGDGRDPLPFCLISVY